MPLLIIAATAAGVILSMQQRNANGQEAGPGAILPPSSASSPSIDATPSKEASGAKGEQVDRAISDCRREVAQAESVLGAAGDGVGHWREHVQAQTDLSLGQNTQDETKAIWKRSKLAGPSDVAKYQTAKSGYKADGQACQPVKGADDDQTDQLKTCKARLDKVKAALSAADRVINDWADHLADMRKSASGQVHNAQDVWMDTWRAAPPNLNKYGTAMEAMAKTKSCPH